MSVVSLLGVKVLNNPAAFNAPYKFEITFECLEQLREGNANCDPPNRVNFFPSTTDRLTTPRQI